MPLSATLVAGVSIFFGGCALTPHGPLYTPLPKPEVKILAATATVELIDEREGVSGGEGFGQRLLGHGEAESEIPAIPADYVHDVEERVDALLDGRAGQIHFVVRVVQGDRGRGAWVGRTYGRAMVELEIDVVEPVSGRLLTQGIVRSWAGNDRRRANAEGLEQLFKAVFLDAFEGFLYDSENILGLNAALIGD